MAQNTETKVVGSPQSGEEDFCIIRPSLIKQLRSILDQYPDDGQILKELIQNAEDAKARKVCFLYDDTQHGTSPDKLADPELGIHQGPALYAFNDAVFDDGDWKGIRMLQDSIKDKDPMKVGRFGLGFKSVFHMTDMPSVLSDKWLAFIDPHEKYFRFEGDSTTGFRYKLSSVNSEFKSKLAHQFDPYQGIFGCNDKTFRNGQYNGTLFRFPLRQKESDLSDTLYTPQKIEALFASFERDAHLVLLFLKYVECIELCVRKQGSPIETLFRVQVQDGSKEYVRTARHEFLAKLSATSWLHKPAKVVYPLLLESEKYENGKVFQKKVHTYIISEYFAGGDSVSRDLKSLCLDQNLSNIPLVGVAYPLEVLGALAKESVDEVDVPVPSGSMTKKRNMKSEVQGDLEYEPEGQVFCFLPLPVEEKSSTGLPVHVNGYFSISQNRRHLKWPSHGQDIHSDREILWNQCLLRELIPKAYVNLVLKSVQFCKENRFGITPEHMRRVLPDMMQVEMRERWKIILEPFYTRILKQQVFYSPAEGGHWVSVSECVFDCLKEVYDTCCVVRKVLQAAGIKVVKIPKHIMLALGAFCTQSLEDITAELTRNCLKRNHSAYTNLTREEKLLLLAYILKDEDFHRLRGIQLLPTADENFVKFTASGGSPIYMPNHDHPREVLHGLDHLLIARDLSDAVMVKLNKLAFEGSMQVQFLNKDVILRLVPSCVPKTWYHQSASVVIQEDDSVTLKWLETLWNYLRQHTPQDLGMLMGCPILVLKKDASSYEVVPLALPSVILLDGATGFHLADEVRRSLGTLGVNVITEVVPYIQSHAAVLGNFIRLPLPDDVIGCITTAVKKGSRETIDKMKSTTTVEEKKALCEFLGRTDDQALHPDHVKILSSLPLFETVACGEKLTKEFVSVHEVNLGAPMSLPDIRIDTQLLDLSKDVVRSLALKLNVKLLSQAEFLTNVVFLELATNMETERLAQTMDYVMDNLHKLQQEKPDFVVHLQKLPFLASEEGKPLTVNKLFDPDVELLKDFFYAEDKFPVGKFAESHFLFFLRQLGLKQCTDIEAEDVLTSAMKIENERDNYDQQIHLKKKSNAVVKYLSGNIELLTTPVHGKLLKDWLKEIAWMASAKDRPGIYPDELDLCNCQMFLTPSSLLPSETVPFAGCVTPVCESPDARLILKSLDLPLLPTVQQVLMQMKRITEVYQPNDKAKYLQLIMSIYAHLENEDVSKVEGALLEIKLQDWVWYGDGFINIDKVIACRSPMDLKPYLYSLPEESQMFERMFREFGVRNKCCPRTLVTVLQDIKELHSTSGHSDTVRARDLQLAVGILNLLKSQLNEVDDFVRQRIVIPIMGDNEEDLCLLPVEECTYCDTEWLQQGIQSLVFEKTEGINFIHPNVPQSTAEALNVPTLMSRMLRAEELSVTGFGQYETLTNRIRSLLEDYTDGYSIPKELVQNADDAGATVVKFLYDERSNFDNMTYLLDEGMKECQGPAFWAYNDAMFSEQDFENITKLGGATKEKEVDKIGKFGLGFNAVYNITDVPSFISGDHLVIFDPHTTHVGRSIRDRSKPGIKIDLQKNKTLIRKLPDQFYPYQNVFDCSINPDKPKSFVGTLFRFPLRTTKQAATSEISQQPYDKHEMMKLLSLFVKGAEALLLFTQHVSRIEVHHMSSSSELSLLFSVEKEKIRTITPLTINPAVQFDVLSACTKNFESLKNSPADVNEMIETSMAIEVKLNVAEKGSLLFDIAPQNSSHLWMLSFVFNMKQKFKTLKKQFELGYCPFGAVAVPLTECDGDYIPYSLTSKGVKGNMYCHLPLPVHTNLPVHINGSFAIQSNRRHLCELTDDDKQSWKATWNDFLLQFVICPAYYVLLRDLIIINQSTNASYITLWPELSSAYPNLQPLLKAFYNDKFLNLVVVHDGKKHVTLSQAAIFDKSLVAEEGNYALAVKAFQQSGAEHSIVTIPESIVDTLNALNLVDVVSPQMFGKKRFLMEVFFPHIAALNNDIRNKVLLWAFELKDEPEIRNTILHKPCIPAGPDGRELKLPSELISHTSKAAKLYHNSESRFVFPKEFKKERVTKLLLELGMQCDLLDWESIIERGHSVEQLFQKNPEHGMERAKFLLKYLDEKIEQERRPDKTWTEEAENEFLYAAASLSEMKILPIVVPPKESPLKWHNWDLLEMNSPLVSAAEACLSSQEALLCSTYPVVDVNFIPVNVQKFLGLQRKSATLDHVFVQFNCVLNLNPAELSKDHPERVKMLQSVCYSIYMFLRNECQKDKDGDLCKMIRDGFGKQACLLVDTRFVRPCDLAFNDKENVAPPFLNAVPPNYFELHSLLRVLGVRDRFEPADYVGHLENLKKAFEEKPIKGFKLRGCLELLSGLERSMDREGLTAQDVLNKVGTIYVPNANGVLMLPEELCFNNCPWLDVSPPANLAHGDLTYRMVTALGVKTQIKELLSDHSTGIPFGQSERLTTSLKRIVDNYPMDHEILKELVQNADDSTATELHFVLDQRTHGTGHVFEDSWKPLQGPALCAYNNRPFTLRDLEGIQRLGEGSKGNDPRKTGQYGIGFSSMYHLTDAPSVLTTNKDLGDMLCVFDPHCYYVPGATKMAPGMRFTNLKMLRASFPDVFPGYLEKHFDMHNSTMFRFPLRNKEMASKSEISKNEVSPVTVIDMFKKFKEEVFEMLLFSNYLETLKVSVIDSTTNMLSTNYGVFTLLSESDREKREEFHKACLRVGAQLKSGEISIQDVKQHKVEYTLTLIDGQEVQEKWRITQVLGFSDQENVNNEIREAYEQSKLALLPRGGVACLLEKRLRGQQVHKHNPGKVFCYLPMPLQTALPVHINGHFAMSFENRQQLWSSTGSDPNFKIAWNDLLCKEVISAAYVELLKSIRGEGLFSSPESAQELACSKQILHGALFAYQDYFPKFSEDHENWNRLVKSVYSVMTSTNAPLFPCVRECHAKHPRRVDGDSPTWSIEWFPLCGEGSQKAFFTPAEVSQPEEIGAQSSFFGKIKNFFQQGNEPKQKIILKDVLRECGFNILEVNPNLVENIKKSGVDVDCMSPEGVRVFFQSYSSQKPMCDLGIPLPAPIGLTKIRSIESLIEILKYCFPPETSFKHLEGMPLLLTNDGMLTVFDSNNPVFASRYCTLFGKSGDLFLHEKVRQELFDKETLEVEGQALKKFTIESLARCLPKKLPEQYCTSDEIPWKKIGCQIGSDIWIRDLWTFVSSELECKRFPQEEDEEYQTRLAVTKSRIEPLWKWCLLPARRPRENILVKVSKAEEIVDTRNIPHEFHNLRDLIVKLYIPTFDYLVLSANSTSVPDFVRNFIATFDKPSLILTAVYKVFADKRDAPSLLLNETQLFLEYFALNVEALKTNEEAIMQLKALPFFKTICGDVISLANCLVYVLPGGMLTDEMDSWQSRSGTVFLQERDKLQPLFDFMGCATLGVLEVYCDFILQHFEYLSRDAQMAHLKHLFDTYLKDNASQGQILSVEEKDHLLASLRDLSIIEDKDGNLHAASHYYDPENILFSVMIEDDRIPPRAIGFRQSEWLSILRKLGLNSSVTPEMCVEFASQIAREGQSPTSGSALLKSKALSEHLLSEDMDNRDEILKKISTIPFIAPERASQDLVKLYPQYGDMGDGKSGLPYVCFKGSYSRKYMDVIWTCASVLPHWAEPQSKRNGQQLCQLLEMDDNPSVDLVVHNFKTVCSAASTNNAVDVQVLKRCCKKSYEFMQQHGFENDKLKTAMHDVADIPSVIVGGSEVLAKPCHTTMNIQEQDEMRPYLCKIPYEYGDFKNIFVALGASEWPRFDQYAIVLDQMHKKTAGGRLTPNELMLVYKATKGLFMSLERSTKDTEKRVNSLSLLGENGCLHESAKLVFNDAPWLYDRVKAYKLRFLVDLKECGLKETTEELITSLPARHRPEMLSSYVKEVLVEDCLNKLVATGLAERLQRRLNERAFHSAVRRLARHQAHKTGQKLSDEVLYNALDNLSTVKVYAADEISTHLLYKDKHVKGSRMEKKCFVEKILDPSGTALCNVYVKNDREMSQDLLIPLAEALNSILNGILRDSVLFLLPVLRCVEEDIDVCLNQLNVHSDLSQAIVRMPTLPAPGSVVPDELHPLFHDAEALHLNIGDFVALQNADGQYVYARLQAFLDDGLCSVDAGENNGSEWSITVLKTFLRQ